MADKELSYDDAAQPRELSYDDAIAPTGSVPFDPSQTFASGEFAEKYAAKAIERYQQKIGPGLFAGLRTPSALPELGRYVAGGAATVPAGLVDGIANLFTQSRKAFYEGLTPQEEIEVAANAALSTIGGGEEFKFPKTERPTAFEDFHEQVTKPVVQTMVGTPPDMPEEATRAITAQIHEAHDLGVVGGPLETVATDTPAEAAFRALPPGPTPLGAAVTPEAMRGKLGHAPGEYDARGKEWVDKIDAPDDAKAAIESMAKQYDFFPEARGGRASLAARNAVAEAAGVDPAEIKSNYFSEHFDSDGKVRATIQFLRQATQDVTDAAEKMRKDPSDENAAAQLVAQERHKNILEYTLGLRAESGRTLAAWKDLLREQERSRAIPKIQAEEEIGKTPEGVGDLVNAAHEVQSGLGDPKPGKTGLDKLVRAAEKLTLESGKERKGGAEPLPADIAGLVNESKNVLKSFGRDPESLARLGKLIGKAEDLVGEPGKAPRAPKVEDIGGLVDAAKGILKDLKNPETLGLDKLISQAERAVGDLTKSQKEGKPSVSQDVNLKELVKTAGAVVNLMKGPKAKNIVDTVLPLRKIERDGTPGPKNALVGFNAVIGEAERNVINITKQKTGRPPKEALPPELQNLVDKANFVTKRFGGIAKGEEAALLLARSGRTAAEQAELARRIEGLTPNQVANVLQRLRNEKRPSWQFWAIQQALISGLITHTKYVAVNTAHTVFERVIAPEAAALIGRARGQKTSLYAPLRAIPEMFNAVPDALAGAKQAFKTNSRVPLESELRLAERGEKSPEAAGAQIPYGTTQGPDWGRVGRWFPQGSKNAETILSGFGRSASAIHTFYKILNERMAGGSRAFEKAEAEGNKPGSEEFWNRYHYHIDHPTDDVLRANVEDGYSGTFMQHLGKQSEAFAKLVRNTPAKWLVFFTHIPLNMARAGVEYSPLAFLNTIGETKMGAAIKGELGADAQNLAFAKIAIGTAIGGYFISRALAGQMTGDYPTNEKERRRWAQEGIPPNSIQGGGQWHSMERLGPQATVARVAANFADVIKNYDGSDNDAFMKATWATVLGTARALASDVGFETIRNIVDIMENPKAAARATAYQLGSYMQPLSFVAQAASFEDPYMRQADSLINGLKYRLPVLRETLPAKRDPLYGEPVHNPGYHSIFRQSPIDTDPVKQELNRIGYFAAPPEKKIGDVKLTDDQYDRYEATAGPLVKKALIQVMSTPQWRMHNNQPDWQKEVAQATVSEARAKAAGVMQADSIVRDGSTNLVAKGREQYLAKHGGQ